MAAAILRRSANSQLMPYKLVASRMVTSVPLFCRSAAAGTGIALGSLLSIRLCIEYSTHR